MSEIIRVEHLKYVYNPGMPDETTALDDVSFRVEEGDFVGIIGSTGSGKSTLISHFNGLNRPTSGRILIDGKDMWEQGADLRAFRFQVGLVMQYPEYQLFEETAYRDIAYGPGNMELPQEEIDERVREAAQWCGVTPELLDRSPFDLSGGQKRRVAIAGVVAMRPEVLILDEPAAGLDPVGREQIFDGIRTYRERTGSTVVIVSHSMEDMAQYCDDVIVLANAKVILQGDRETVYAHGDLLEKTGLDVPQITRLIGMLRKRGFDLPANIYTVDRAYDVLRERLCGR